MYTETVARELSSTVHPAWEELTDQFFTISWSIVGGLTATGQTVGAATVMSAGWANDPMDGLMVISFDIILLKARDLTQSCSIGNGLPKYLPNAGSSFLSDSQFFFSILLSTYSTPSLISFGSLS